MVPGPGVVAQTVVAALAGKGAQHVRNHAVDVLDLAHWQSASGRGCPPPPGRSLPVGRPGAHSHDASDNVSDSDRIGLGVRPARSPSPTTNSLADWKWSRDPRAAGGPGGTAAPVPCQSRSL
jgi:hypothetical protein